MSDTAYYDITGFSRTEQDGRRKQPEQINGAAEQSEADRQPKRTADGIKKITGLLYPVIYNILASAHKLRQQSQRKK